MGMSCPTAVVTRSIRFLRLAYGKSVLSFHEPKPPALADWWPVLQTAVLIPISCRSESSGGFSLSGACGIGGFAGQAAISLVEGHEAHRAVGRTVLAMVRMRLHALHDSAQALHHHQKDKKKVAEKWCERSSTYNTKHGGKPWRYVLIAHDRISENMAIEALL
jgi:hypothetical protein